MNEYLSRGGEVKGGGESQLKFLKRPRQRFKIMYRHKQNAEINRTQKSSGYYYTDGEYPRKCRPLGLTVSGNRGHITGSQVSTILIVAILSRGSNRITQALGSSLPGQ